MLLTTATTALLMGMVGGVHCLAMCAAPCGAIVGGAAGPADPTDAQGREHRVHWVPSRREVQRGAAFHAGRLAGYALAGALAALAMDSLAWLTQHTMALRPAWTMVHVAVLAWGLMLALQARQPAWIEQAGRKLWVGVRPLVNAPGGVVFAGLLWALMPCGLLYSALLAAALSGGPLEGAVTMLAFGAASGAWLVAGPWTWTRLRARLNQSRAQWGTRVAGGLLCALAVWALWIDLVYKPSLWCR